MSACNVNAALAPDLASEVAAIREELAALSELLFCKGIVGEGRFRAQLHQRRFRRALERYPLKAEGATATLQAAMCSKDIAASIFAFVGFPVSCFRAGSKALSQTATPAELKASSIGRIFVVGGESNGQYLASAEVFNPELDRWEDLPPIPAPRAHSAATSLRGKLYICGGSDGLQVSQRVVAYVPSTQMWIDMPPMVHRREGAAAACGRGLLVVAGGGDGLDLHTSSECLDPESDGCWMLLPNMEEPRYGCTAVSLHGQVHVCGGGGRRGTLASVECYDDAEGQWQDLPPMRDARERFAAAVVQGRIYVCGGWSEGSAEPSARVLRSVERFDPQIGHWEDLAPMPQRRHSLAAAVLGGQLWVCGGSYGRQDVRTVEVYDVDTFAWVQMPSMHMPRNCASMAFVRY